MGPRSLLVVLAVTCVGIPPALGGEAGNELVNPGFEESQNATLVGWDKCARGYVIDRTTLHSGAQSIRCTSTGEKDCMGAMQTIKYDTPDKRPIVVGGWCKTRDVRARGNCCVYLDIIYEDGTPWWGRTNCWQRGTHDWEYDARICYPARPVKEIGTFVFLRRTTGTAWFDDIKVCRGGLHVTTLSVVSDFPRTRGLHVRADPTEEARWECEVLGSAGALVASHKGTGKRLFWRWPSASPMTSPSVGIRAQTATGHRAELTTKVHLPSRPWNPVRNGYAVWTRSSMAKVYPTELPTTPDKPTRRDLALARNEREGFQIVVTPADDSTLKRVRVQASDFVDKEGAVFPKANIRWHVVGYVWVDRPSGHPLAPRRANWCPDVLLPAKPFDVSGGSSQSVWVNFHATETVKPGVYRGSIAVRPANAEATEVAVTLRVRRFLLPRSPRMRNAFAMMDGPARHTYGALSPELRRRCIDIMLDHRLNPDDISRTEPPRLEDLLYARARGMNAFNIINLVPKLKTKRLWICYAPKTAYGPNFNHELAARLDGYVAQLRKHGLSKMAYFYGFDERREDYDPLIKKICEFLRERYPEVSTFTTAGYMYKRRAEVALDYEDYMDWYCPLSSVYDAALSATLRNVGKQVWW